MTIGPFTWSSPTPASFMSASLTSTPAQGLPIVPTLQQSELVTETTGAHSVSP